MLLSRNTAGVGMGAARFDEGADSEDERTTLVDPFHFGRRYVER